MFIFTESNSSMHENPEKRNKHVSQNHRSGKLAVFPPNLLTKEFIISDVIDYFGCDGFRLAKTLLPFEC